MQLNFLITDTRGTASTILICYTALVAILISLHSLILVIRDIDALYKKLDNNQRLALRCVFPLPELFQENFKADKLILSDFPDDICLLPETDFASRQKPIYKLNPALCALLKYTKSKNFRAWGKTCN